MRTTDSKKSVEVIVAKWGNSMGLRINSAIAKAANIVEGTAVTLTVDKETNVLTVTRVDNNLNRDFFTEKELLAGMNEYLAHTDEIVDPTSDEFDY